MTTQQHNAILSDGATRLGISERDYKETLEYAGIVRELLRPQVGEGSK